MIPLREKLTYADVRANRAAVVSKEVAQILKKCQITVVKTANGEEFSGVPIVYVAPRWAYRIADTLRFVIKRARIQAVLRKAAREDTFRDALEAALDGDILYQFVRQQGFMKEDRYE